MMLWSAGWVMLKVSGLTTLSFPLRDLFPLFTLFRVEVELIHVQALSFLPYFKSCPS